MPRSARPRPACAHHDALGEKRHRRQGRRVRRRLRRLRGKALQQPGAGHAHRGFAAPRPAGRRGARAAPEPCGGAPGRHGDSPQAQRGARPRPLRQPHTEGVPDHRVSRQSCGGGVLGPGHHGQRVGRGLSARVGEHRRVRAQDSQQDRGRPQQAPLPANHLARGLPPRRRLDDRGRLTKESPRRTASKRGVSALASRGASAREWGAPTFLLSSTALQKFPGRFSATFVWRTGHGSAIGVMRKTVK